MLQKHYLEIKMNKNALITTMLDKFITNLVEMIAAIMWLKDLTPEIILYRKEAKSSQDAKCSRNKIKEDNMNLEQSTITRSGIIANREGMAMQYIWVISMVIHLEVQICLQVYSRSVFQYSWLWLNTIGEQYELILWIVLYYLMGYAFLIFQVIIQIWSHIPIALTMGRMERYILGLYCC